MLLTFGGLLSSLLSFLWQSRAHGDAFPKGYLPTSPNALLCRKEGRIIPDEGRIIPENVRLIPEEGRIIPGGGTNI